jgi:hypothetical protein
MIVMITESISSPDAFARWPATRTTTRLGYPACIATMVRFESGNNIRTMSPRRQFIVLSQSPGDPNPQQMGPTGGANRLPGSCRFLFDEDLPGPRVEPTSQ